MLRKLVAILCALTLAVGPVGAQQFRPGQPPAFRSGFQFLGGAGGYPSPGATLDYDWVRDRYVGPALTTTRATEARQDDSAGNWSTFGPNVMRRTDKGSLIEGASTNSIRNNSMQGVSPSVLLNAIRNNSGQGAVVGQSQNAIRNSAAVGAVAGQSQNAVRNSAMVGAAPAQVTNYVRNSASTGAVPGTPGTYATNWSGPATSANGLSQQLIGTGTENGVDYTELRIFGTPTATATAYALFAAETSTGVAASPSQAWTASASFRLSAGSMSGVTNFQMRLRSLGSTGSSLADVAQVIPVTSASLDTQRYSISGTTPASTTNVNLISVYGVTAGTPVDFTIRVGLPQLEQSTFAGFPVRTTNGAVTLTPSNQIRNNTMQGVALGQSQNAIRNNSMQGAVVGAPGSQPNFWTGSLTGAGLSQQIVSTGSVSGLDYVDIRVTGTTTAVVGTVLYFDGSLNTVSATTGQPWSVSSYLSLIGGSLTNVTLDLALRENDSAAAFLRQTLVSLSGATSVLTRYTASATTGATTGGMASGIRLGVASGSPVDFTIRIASPQLEQSATAGPVTRTTGTAAAFVQGPIPTNWSSGLAGFGLSQQIVGAGVSNGLDYFDIRVFGTTTAGSSPVNLLYFDATVNVAPASSGQTWTQSVYTALIGGSFSNVTSLDVTLRENDVASTPNFIRQTFSSLLGIGSTLSRNINTVTVGTSTAGIATAIRLAAPASTAIDFTLRIASPQLEQAPTAGPVVKTNGTAVAPVAAGQVPSIWVGYNTGSGLTQQVVGTGTTNGLDYIDLQISGTTTAAVASVGFVSIEQSTGISAVSGQTWDFSTYAQLLSGSLTNVTLAVDVSERASTGALLTTHLVGITPDGNLTRYQTAALFTNASTANAQPLIRITAASGVAVNFTLRVAAPQLEQAPGAGPWTRTTGTAAAFIAGTLPTNWALPLVTNLNFQVVGSGVETGIDYIDLRLFGSAGLTSEVIFDTSQPSAIAGQVWTGSAFAKLAGGTLTNVSALSVRVLEQGGTNPSTNVPFTPTNSALGTQRTAATRTLTDAGSTSVRVRMPFTTTGAFDTTIRIGLPQLEQAPGAGPVTRTTGTVAAFASGTLPNFWVTTGSAGLLQQIVGTGTENGIDYVEIRHSGTATANNLRILFEQLATTPAADGQTWTGSAYLRLTGGSLATNQTELRTVGQVDAIGTQITPTGASLDTQRYSNSRTLSGGNTNVTLQTRFAFTIGNTYDFTVRIGLPQLEPNATAGTVQRTTGFAAWSAGTLPTNWNSSIAPGLSRQVVGTGAQNGIDYVDLRVYGFGQSSSANLAINLNFDGGASTAAATGQLWTLSTFASLAAGTIPANVSTPKLVVTELTSAFASTYRTSDLALGASLIRSANSQTLAGASTAYVQPGIWVYGPNVAGTPVDFTVRIGWPQLEQWFSAVTTIGGASSPIRTTNGAATRAADLITFNANAISGLQGTIAFIGRPGNVVASSGTFFSFGNAANTSPVVQFRSRGAPNQGAIAGTADNTANFAIGTNTGVVVPGARFAAAFAWQANDNQLAANGNLDTFNGTSTPVAALGNGYIGTGLGLNAFWGYAERAIFRPDRAANSNLQPLSIAN
jgi:hypothetical protein